jgi:Ca-activated chloride channel family protein
VIPHLADLWLLAVLAPLIAVWLIAWGWLESRGSTHSALRFSSIARLKQLRTAPAVVLRRLVVALRIPAVLLLAFAMLRPQLGRTETKVSTEGVDIQLVVDTSGSMAALDLDDDKPIAQRRSRLDVVKDVIAEFVDERPADQLGLVVFGTEAFTQCPLTLDHGVVTTLLKRVKIGMAGQSTAVGNALGIAVRRLQDSPAQSKVVVLLTDGRSNAGALPPLTAADAAAALGVKVYTIGAGSPGKAPILVDSLFGQQVQYIEADLDEDTLQQIAERTGGAYFRATDAKSLRDIYARIDELEKTELELERYTDYEDLYAWLVAPALLLLLLELLLLGTRFRKLP